jgi:hypothetical protein
MKKKEHADNQIIYVTNSAYDELQSDRPKSKQQNSGEKNKTVQFDDL